MVFTGVSCCEDCWNARPLSASHIVGKIHIQSVHCCALVKATRAWSAATLLRYVQPLNLCCSHTSCFCRCSLFVSLHTNTQGRTTVHTTGQMQAEKHRSLLLNAVIQRPMAFPGRSMAVGKATWRTRQGPEATIPAIAVTMAKTSSSSPQLELRRPPKRTAPVGPPAVSVPFTL